MTLGLPHRDPPYGIKSWAHWIHSDIRPLMEPDTSGVWMDAKFKNVCAIPPAWVAKGLFESDIQSMVIWMRALHAWLGKVLVEYDSKKSPLI